MAAYARYIPGPKKTPVYERVAPAAAVASDVTAPQEYRMSEEMRKALAEVVLPDDVEEKGLDAELTTQDLQERVAQEENMLRRKRYNYGAPPGLDWSAISWRDVLEASSTTPPPFLNISNNYSHPLKHSDILANTPFLGMLRTDSHYHPAAMLFQLYGRDTNIRKGKGSKPVHDVKGFSAAACFAAMRHRMTETDSPQTKLMEFELSKALFLSVTKYHGISPAALFFYTAGCVYMNEPTEIERIIGAKRFEREQSCKAICIGALVQLLCVEGNYTEAEALMTRHTSTTEYSPAEELLICRSVIAHLLSQGGDEAIRGMALLKTIPQDSFLKRRREFWLALVEMLSAKEIGLEMAVAVVEKVVPYLAHPSLWSEELLEVVLMKYVHEGPLKDAYSLLKTGENAGLQRHHRMLRIPAPRRGFGALLAVACGEGNARFSRRITQFMLQDSCRPQIEEIHHLFVVHSKERAQFAMYQKLLLWAKNVPEVKVADATLIESFGNLPFEAVDEVFEVFNSTLELLGSTAYEVLFSHLFRHLLRITGHPVRSFVEFLIYIPTAYISAAHSETKFPVRLSSPEVNGALIHLFESENIPLNLLDEPLQDSHAHWSGGGYVVSKISSGSKVVPGERSLDRVSTDKLSDVEYTAVLSCTDAFLLTPFDGYELNPAHNTLPDNALSAKLFHWSTLLWSDSALLEKSDEESGRYIVLPVRQLHSALQELDRMKKEHLEVIQQDEFYRPVAFDYEFGKDVLKTFRDIRDSLKELQKRRDSIIEFAEKCCLLTYKEEMSLIGAAASNGIHVHLRTSLDHHPSEDSFAAIANTLDSEGVSVECAVHHCKRKNDLRRLLADTVSLGEVEEEEVAEKEEAMSYDHASLIDHQHERWQRCNKSLWSIFGPPLPRKVPIIDRVVQKRISKMMSSCKSHASFTRVLSNSVPAVEMVKNLPWKEV